MPTNAMTPSLNVRIGGASDAGIKSVNQDAYAAHHAHGNALRLKGIVLAIADGVSHCNDSHIASQTSVTSFINDYYGTPDSWSVSYAVPKVLKAINSWLQQHNANAHRQRDTLLCTFSSLVIKSNQAHCFHVGDSRIYHLSENTFEQLTRDHQRKHNGHQYLTRALGGELHLQVDYSHHSVQVGDRLLLSTDGIHEHLSDAEIQQIISHPNENLEELAQTLINQALRAGSDDNLTALIVEITELPQLSLTERFQQISQLLIPPVLEPGNSIDGYEVLEVLFSGTRSHLYLVQATDDQGTFVLKAPSLNFSEDIDYLEGFVREEWVGQQLNHPNVMKTFPSGKEKRFLYLLCEHVPGQDLRQWMLDNPKPTIDQVRQIVLQVIQALRALQRADMIHQDLKPENILIDQHGRVKLIDFGTVYAASISELDQPAAENTPLGAIGYCAPEYLAGESASVRSDLFSLAVICYEMLTGQLPYPSAKQSQSTLKSYAELSYTPALHHRQDLPLWLEGCLRKALQPNPQHRYPALSEFQQDLTKPNKRLEAKIEHQPLLERNPLRFWQLLALFFLGMNIVQLLL